MILILRDFWKVVLTESGISQEAVNIIAYTLSTLLLKRCEQEQCNQAFASKTNTKLL